jgi:hypothetical protein
MVWYNMVIFSGINYIQPYKNLNPHFVSFTCRFGNIGWSI